MFEPTLVGIEAAPQIAAFTRVACPFDLLSTSTVERAVFDEPDPSSTFAFFDTGLEGVASAVVLGEDGYVKFLAVHPRVRLRGLGSRLLETAEAFCRDNGATSVQIGNSAPFYVVPGVDVRVTEALCFLESRGYRRTGDAVNQNVRLHGLDEPALPCHDADEHDLDRIMPWVAEEYPNWVPELQRSFDLGTTVVHDDLGFACYDVNRDGWFGPMATRRDVRSTRGVGRATLLAVLHRMRARGYDHAEIAWSGPLLFYMKAVGARVSRVFWTYAKRF